jgi:hypothetical protein
MLNNHEATWKEEEKKRKKLMTKVQLNFLEINSMVGNPGFFLCPVMDDYQLGISYL